ncbi:MAG: hypothetical protein MUE53_02895 [Chitinophagales bacterium]|jgi:cell fate regulator YaaT (PSP1 superfamily)|nr:hypothetical protein [Chitinophagales bacterium]
MGCGSSCGSGGCSSGGCNKLNAFDWFSNIDQKIEDKLWVEVSFKGGNRKDFFLHTQDFFLADKSMVVVESDKGYDIGQVMLKGFLAKVQAKKKKAKIIEDEMPKVLRLASDEELKQLETLRKKEAQMMLDARVMAKKHHLDMKFSDVEYQADGKKAIFYFIADNRVDFRELIKSFITHFRIKIELKQISARQEAAIVGGIGSCGRELCCSSWLTQFKTVTTQAARYQNLSINMDKLSGQCGRMKCCLNFELSQYIESFKQFPEKFNTIKTDSGFLELRKTEILKKLLWFQYKEGKDRNMYKISLEKALEIAQLMKSGQTIRSITDFTIAEIIDLEKEDPQEDLVGQVSLSMLEDKKTSSSKRKKKKKKPNNPKNDAP